MSEAKFVLELLDRYARAPDARAKLRELKESLDKYELSETERRDIEALIEHELGSTGEEKEKEIYVRTARCPKCGEIWEDHESVEMGEVSLWRCKAGYSVAEVVDYRAKVIFKDWDDAERFKECYLSSEQSFGDIEDCYDKVKGIVGRGEVKSEGEGEAVEEVSDNEAKMVELVTSFKTNPDGLADIVENGISPELKAKFAAAIRARLERSGAVEAMDWEKNVGEILERCEKAGGIAQFRTRYASKRFEDREHPGRFLVLFICYGRHWGTWLCSVPLKDVERLEAD